MALYVPGVENLLAVIITWGIGLALLLIGAALHGFAAAPEYRIAAGWGALCVILTLWGVFVPASLRVPAIVLLAAAILYQMIPGRRVARADWAVLGCVLLLTLPLWAVMAPVRPSQVDTFLNLLPNADYLADYARLPTADLPPSYSLYPAAPYNTQFLAFLGSSIERDYPATGMSLINIILQLIAGLAVARALARPGAAPSWAGLALGMLLVTLLNPGFVPRFHFSSYGETGLAVTALLAACLFVAAQSSRAAGAGGAHLAELALILAAMINVKQSGIGLVLALAGAALAVGMAERAAGLRRAVGPTALVLLPAALLYIVWRYYAEHAGVAELKPLPFGKWNWAVLPDTFIGIGRAIASKPAYFVAEAVAIVCFPVLLRCQGWSPATRFLAFNAAVFVFYNAFLVVTYVAHFSPLMSEEAHSYFRYNTHLSLIMMLALALAVRELSPGFWARPRVSRYSGAVIVVLGLLSPVALAERLRFDIAMPQPLVWDMAKELQPYLKDGDRLALLTPGDNGEVGSLIDAYLANEPPRRRGLVIAHYNAADTAALAAAAADGYELAAITCTPAGLDGLPAGVVALLKHGASGWSAVASWPQSSGIPLSRWQRNRHWPAFCR
jgi:hypothetical protein